MRVLYAKNGGTLAVEAEKEASFDFLFQHIEFRCGEELTEGDLKTITKLLNRCRQDLCANLFAGSG